MTRGAYKHCQRDLVAFLMLAVSPVLCRSALAQVAADHLRPQRLAASSLSLIKPTDSDFDATLEAYFPGISSEDGYQQAIRPFLVIVKNETPLPAESYAITWTAHYTPGWVRPLRAVYVNRPLIYGPARTYIPPDAVRLISPRFNVSSKQYLGNTYFAQMHSASRFPPSNQLASVDVGVDGVVYTDGSFIGADTTHIFELHAVARFADRDEVSAALNLIQSATAPQQVVAQQLLQTLNQEIQRDGTATQDNLLARYVRARDLSAQDLRRMLRDRGLPGLETFLQNFVSRSGGNTNPSVLGTEYQNLSENDPRVFGHIPWNPRKP